jgi:bacterioferritin-associated ferredoxin
MQSSTSQTLRRVSFGERSYVRTVREAYTDCAYAFSSSAWIDPSDTIGSFVLDNPNYHTDFLTTASTSWSSVIYTGLPGLLVLSQPYINLKLEMYKTKVPLWVNASDAGILYFDIKEWSKNMREAGNNITLTVEKVVPHNIFSIRDMIGFGKECDKCAKQAGEWLRKMLPE